MGINPIWFLVFAAVVNGVVAVPLLAMIANINRRKSILGEYTGGLVGNTLIWIACGVMALASIAMFYTLATG